MALDPWISAPTRSPWLAGSTLQPPTEPIGTIAEESATVVAPYPASFATGEDHSHAGAFDYEFRLWPNEQTWEHPIFEVFEMYPRLCFTMTEDEFGGFRDVLERSGFSLRETSRVPHHDPEAIH